MKYDPKEFTEIQKFIDKSVRYYWDLTPTLWGAVKIVAGLMIIPIIFSLIAGAFVVNYFTSEDLKLLKEEYKEDMTNRRTDINLICDYLNIKIVHDKDGDGNNDNPKDYYIRGKDE